jgi:hypothetical protein
MAYSKEEMKEYKANWYAKHRENAENREKDRISCAKRRENAENREKDRISCEKRRNDITKHALESLVIGEIDDQTKWKYFCNRIKSHAKSKKKPYSENFTDYMIFEMMSKGCYYCMNTATTIDRVDSNIGHIPENCVGSCLSCNSSKGNGDRDSFLRKAYYRSQKEYYDDDLDIWSDNVQKPNYNECRKKAMRQKVVFELTKEQWNTLVKENCVYCLRSLPSGKYNGVDRVIPSDGYTSNNTVSCCDDCNRDKGMLSVESMKSRNDKISERMKSEEIVIVNCDKVLRYVRK